MAEDAEEQLDRSDFTCPFCLDILHEPVLLPCCSANFCRPCLQEMIDGGLGSCPTCRKPMPVVDARRLPVNRLVASVIDKYLPEGARRRAAEATEDRAAAVARDQPAQPAAPVAPAAAPAAADRGASAVPHSREECEQMSVRELKAWLRTTGVSSVHCIEKYELVHLAQSFFLESAEVSGGSSPAAAEASAGAPPDQQNQPAATAPEPDSRSRSSSGMQRGFFDTPTARAVSAPEPEPAPEPPQPQRAPLVFGALSDDDDDDYGDDPDGSTSTAGGYSFAHRAAAPAPAAAAAEASPPLVVFGGSDAFEQEGNAPPPVETFANPVAQDTLPDNRGAAPSPPLPTAAWTGLTGDRMVRFTSPSPASALHVRPHLQFLNTPGSIQASTYCSATGAASAATTGLEGEIEMVIDDGDQFLVDGSVKVLKEYLRNSAKPGDGAD